MGVLDNENTVLRSQLALVNENYAKSLDEISELSEKNRNFHNSNDISIPGDITEKMDKQHQKIVSLETELAEASNKIVSLSASCDAAMEKIASLDKENRSVRTSQNTITFLKNKIIDLQEDRNKLRDDKNKLRDDKNKLREDKNKLQDDKNKLQDEKDKLREEKDKSEEEISALRENIQLLRDEKQIMNCCDKSIQVTPQKLSRDASDTKIGLNPTNSREDDWLEASIIKKVDSIDTLFSSIAGEGPPK